MNSGFLKGFTVGEKYHLIAAFIWPGFLGTGLRTGIVQNEDMRFSGTSRHVPLPPVLFRARIGLRFPFFITQHALIHAKHARIRRKNAFPRRREMHLIAAFICPIFSGMAFLEHPAFPGIKRRPVLGDGASQLRFLPLLASARSRSGASSGPRWARTLIEA